MNDIPEICKKCSGTGYIQEKQETYGITFYKSSNGLVQSIPHKSETGKIIRFIRKSHAVTFAQAECTVNGYDNYILCPDFETPTENTKKTPTNVLCGKIIKEHCITLDENHVICKQCTNYAADISSISHKEGCIVDDAIKLSTSPKS